MLWRVVAFLVLVSLIVGYSNSRSPVRADPVVCVQYTCKEVHLYWKGEAKYARAIYDGSEGPQNSARENIWTDKSDQRVPDYSGTATWYHYTWTSCTPLCGKDANGVWLAQQELIAVTGTKGKQEDADELFRATCLLSGGVQTDPQGNNNKDKNSPPGFKGD